MPDTKKVDPAVISVALEYGVTKARREIPTYFDLFPSSPTSSSVKVTKTSWTEIAGKAIDESEPVIHKHLASFLGQGLPEVDDDTDLYNPAYPPKPDEPEPEEEMYGYTNKEKAVHKGVIHISGNYPERFVFSKDGPEYGNDFLIVCNDGQQMHITTPTRGFIIGQGGRKYVAGEPYFISGEALEKYPTMEYYADYSTKPTECFVYHNSKVATKRTSGAVSTMPETKNVEPAIIRIALEYGLQKARREAPTYFDDFPETTSADGVEVKKSGWVDTVNNTITELEPIVHKHLESFLGQELPDAPEEEEDLYNPTNTDDVENAPELQIMIMPKTGTISVDGINRNRFVFPKVGPAYGTSLYFKFSNGDTMVVKDSSRGFELNNKHHKYQPGYTYSYNPPDPTIPTMEVYLKADATAERITMYYKGEVEVTPPEVIEDGGSGGGGGWNRIEWEGDPNLDWYTDDSRDRTWWTEIHGSSGGSRDWSRKFPLPKKVESAGSLEFRFSDGTKLTVNDPHSMAMLSNGPKYRPETPGESDPRKQHPKVGAVPGSPVTWVEWRDPSAANDDSGGGDGAGGHGYNSSLRINWAGEMMSHRDENDDSKGSTKQRLFRFPKCGREYGGRVKVVWSDGLTLDVPNAGSRHYLGAWTDKRKWQPGCGDGSTPDCECYAKVGSNPEYVDLFYNK